LPPVRVFIHWCAVIKPFDVVNIRRLFLESNFHNWGTEYDRLRLGLKINLIEFITGFPLLYFKKIFNKFEFKLSIL
jgi:hypothetical protein